MSRAFFEIFLRIARAFDIRRLQKCRLLFFKAFYPFARETI
jgi:hypothetical protein